ncbi:MAG TPA: metallopeptidase family protein [Acidimicrobiales bacterium]
MTPHWARISSDSTRASPSKRGPNSCSGVMPDRITPYQTTICRCCSNEDEVKARIRKTVIHEVAHQFGISDPRLEELGWA